MDVFARVVVGVDGTEWGLGALRQALTLAPIDASTIDAVTALDTTPAVWTGFEAGKWAELLELEAQAARDEAAAVLGGRAGSARIVKGSSVPVLRQARDELDATLLALGGRHSSRLLGIVLGDTVTELVHDGRCSVLVARPPEQLEGCRARSSPVSTAPRRHSPASPAPTTSRRGSAARWRSSPRVKPPRLKRPGRSAPNASRRPPVATLLEHSRKADLLVVGPRSLHGLRALGSVSERIAHGASCSVLVVHPPATPEHAPRRADARDRKHARRRRPAP